MRSPYHWDIFGTIPYTKSIVFSLMRSQWTAVSSHLELEDDNKNMVRVYG
ncbi:MAG: hypothetical protein V7L14_24130 [Nostoc sp.]